MADNNDSNNGNGAPPAAPAVPPEWAHLTPDQVKELEGVRTERIKAETRLEELRHKSADLERENTTLKQRESVKAALKESGVRFHDNDVALKLVGEIEYDKEHNAIVGSKPLALALQELALDKENLADGRSLRSLKEKREAENPQPKSKADFDGDVKAKTSFINEFGLAAYEALPARPPVKLNGRLPSREEWKHMSVPQKTAVVAQHGSSIVFKIGRGDFDKR